MNLNERIINVALSRWWFSLLVIAGVFGFLIISQTSNKSPEVYVSAERPIIPDVPRDAIPPLDTPAYETREEADEWFPDDEFIVGVELNGDARAYSIKILNWHEIVNETIGDIPVAVTYCPLCRSAVVFDRRLEVNGEEIELSFGNTGSLYESAMVMYDRETNSDWYHVPGLAIRGELEGSVLTILPSSVMTYAEWKERHPQTLVLSRETGYERPYSRDAFEAYDNITSDPEFPVSRIDKRLPTKEKILGVTFNGESKAYPFRNYKGETIIDEVGGVNLEIVVNEEGRAAEIFILEGDTRSIAPTTNAFWFAWALSHPDTKIYTK